jgi:glycosyltransferase involved in cell wall biosynthesis
MPSYNHARYLDRAIGSVLSQTPSQIELIVVDDYSTDRSKEVIRDWIVKDSRIKAVFHRTNQGIARTVNEAIGIARGKYVALMASDDSFRAGCFEKILQRLESNDDYGVAIVEGECVDDQDGRIGLLFSQLHRRPSLLAGDFFGDLTKSNFVCTGFIRRHILKQYAIHHDETLRFLSDWLFWLDLSAVCNFVYLSEPCYYYRIHGANTSQDREGMASDQVRACDYILEKYESRLDNRARSLLGKMKAGAWARCSRDFGPVRNALRESLAFSLPGADLLETLGLLAISQLPALFRLYLTMYDLVLSPRRQALLGTGRPKKSLPLSEARGRQY